MPRRTDPKLAARAADRALAQRIGFRGADFPRGWEQFERDEEIEQCYFPAESDLTMTARARSPLFASLTESSALSAASTVSIFLNAAQARAAFDREAQRRSATCFATELEEEKIPVRVSTIRFQANGARVRGFRLQFRVADPEEPDAPATSYTADLVYVQRGRAVVNALFAAANEPFKFEGDLVRTLAIRASGA